MIKLDRDYQSTGVISAGSGIYVLDTTLNKYVLLVPTSDMPAGAGAPDTIDNPLLTVSRNGQVEGKQTVQQKEYTYNWNRDNNRRLAKYAGTQQSFLERDGMEYTGNLFNGTLTYDKDAFADNELMAGKLYITVNEDTGYDDDIRDIIAPTAIITNALPSVTIKGTGTASIVLKTSEGATVTPTSESTSVATVAMGTGDNANKLTITGVAVGTTIVKLVCSATNEGSSERTIMVKVVPNA
jgi:hypothetical protein